MNAPDLPFNWFDLVVLATLVVGGIIGRKKGMSEELLPVFQWLAIMVVSGLYYKPVGKFLAGYTSMSLLMSYMAAYLGIVVTHILFFQWLKKLVGEKLVASDIFGGLEYYLGAGAGAARFSCVLIVVLALLNARYISPEQLAADAKMQRENFGSISFPTFGLFQEAVLQKSTSGRLVKKYLADQLIEATVPGQRVVQREGVGKRREQAVDEVLGGRK